METTEAVKLGPTAQRFVGKVALVTGGTGGIGGAVVERLVAEGAQVIAVDAAENEFEATSSQRYAELDVRDETAWSTLVDEVVDSEGRIDALVNCAGIGGRFTLEETEPELWHRVLDTNLLGSWLGMRAAAPAMRREGGGAIVNISSIYGVTGSAGNFPYHAAKGGVRTMSKAAAVQLAAGGIRVNTICPGLIATPLTATHKPEVWQHFIDKSVIKRAGRPDEVAALIAFLLSEEAGYITGAEVAIDGGFLAY